MTERWYVTAGSETIGPATVEEIVVAIRAGRVTDRSEVCVPGASTWSPIGSVPAFASALAPPALSLPAPPKKRTWGEILSTDLATGKPVERAPAEAPASSTAPGGRYGNLLTVASGLRSYGGLLQGLGTLLGIGGVLAGMAVGASSPWPAIGVIVAVVAVGFALGVHALGTMVAASGEAMVALADIATNTSRKA